MKKNKLAYFVVKSSMFGIGYFLLFKDNGKNAWISVILGTIIGIAIIYLYSLIKKVLHNKGLMETLKTSKLGKIYLIIIFIFYLLIITINILILSIFVNSFYLVNTPKLVIIIPFIIIAIYLAYKNESVLLSMSNLLFVVSVLIVIIYSILLSPYFEYQELLPFFNYKINSVIKGAIIYASITSIPQILIIDYYKKSKDIFKDYLIGSLINILIITGTILGLGNSLIKIYSFPEYEVLKQIKILDFIENIENISTFGWYSELFIMLTILITNLKKALPKKANKISLLIILSIITYTGSFLIGGNYIITLNLFYYYPFILIGFIPIFITLLLYLKFYIQ